MKRFLLMAIAAALLIGCASIGDDQKYADIAEEQPFSYFFPTSSTTKTFSNIDRAYNFIKAAQYKLKKSIKLRRAKGLAAKLTGPTISDYNPVILTYFITATNSEGYIDLSKKRVNLESSLKNVISVSSVFMVFYEGRAVSISDFYLDEDYRYNLNDQYTNFNYRGNVYRTQYPFGWGITKAFQYLKKEIN